MTLRKRGSILGRLSMIYEQKEMLTVTIMIMTMMMIVMCSQLTTTSLLHKSQLSLKISMFKISSKLLDAWFRRLIVLIKRFFP